MDCASRRVNGAGIKTDENDHWSSSTSAAQAAVGVFALAPRSNDAVLVATLAPGNYTAQVSGVGGTSGVALVEIHELPYSPKTLRAVIIAPCEPT